MIQGRDDELRTVGRLLDEVRAGRGGALVIRGEPGIGKSALLDESLTGTGDMTVLRGSGVESEVELAFSGLHQVLAPVLAEVDQLPPAQADALRRALGQVTGETTDLFVCVAALDLLRCLAGRRPVVVVVDDVQDLDRASALVLLFAARRLAGSRVGMVLAVRDPAERTVATGDLPQLRLSGLDMAAAVRLLAGMDSAAAGVLVAATGGNPLALTELSRADQSDELIRGVVTKVVPVGTALRDAFARRMAALPPHGPDVLLVAAAEETGLLTVVYAVCRVLDLPVEPLAAAERAGLVTIDGDRVRFSHPLMRSAAYSRAPAEQRRRVHAAIAAALSTVESTSEVGVRASWHRALATVGPDDALADTLARSAEAMDARGGLAASVSVLHEAARLSGSAEQRSRFTVRAADAAAKSGQVTLSRSLLARIDTNPADTATADLVTRLRGLLETYGGDQVTAYELLVRGARSVSGRSPELAAELLFMAVDAGLHAGRMADAAGAALDVVKLSDDPAYQRYGRWLAASVTDTLDEAGTEPWQVFDAAPEPVQRSGAHRWLLPMAISWRGRHVRQAREFGVVACEQLRANGMLTIFTIPLTWLVDLDYRLGRWADGITHAEEGLRAARDADQQPRAADFLSQLAMLAAARGEAAECRHHANLALATAAPVRNRFAAARATWALGTLDLALGDYESARERLTLLDASGLPEAHEQVARDAIADMVEACVRTGDLPRAARLTDRFERCLPPSAPAWTYACLHRCRALVADSDTDTADKEYQLALSMSDSEDRPFDQARTALLYGQWLRRNRRVTQARGPLRISMELFDDLGAAPWTERARSELRACGGSAPRLAPGPETVLTPQELDVARLAASGLSNRQIGAKLFLSHRTVGYHLHKIFPKLGISSRAQLRGLELPSGS